MTNGGKPDLLYRELLHAISVAYDCQMALVSQAAAAAVSESMPPGFNRCFVPILNEHP